MSLKGLTNNSKSYPAWPDKVDAGNILRNNFHPRYSKISLRRNVWWYSFRRHAIYKLLQNKLYRPYWPSIGPSFHVSLFFKYFPNSNNRMRSYLHLCLDFFTNNIGLIMVLFWKFYSCQLRHGHILISLEAPLDLSETLVCIFSDMAFFWILPLPGKTLICLWLNIFHFRFHAVVCYPHLLWHICCLLFHISHITTGESSRLCSLLFHI